jgi:galactose mutarotase-like enzyme
MIDQRTMEGFPASVLASAEGELEAAFVPGAGMVGCSLRHRGEELLGQRGGLGAYVAEHGTMGIPLLHPWANRLARERFRVAGREVVLDSAATPLGRDPNGLPIHGLLAAASGWTVERHEALGEGALLIAEFDFGAHPRLIAAFPFPHLVSLEARLAGRTLTIVTTVRATGEATVPISFGYHPYFTLPGSDRSEWQIELPVTERLRLDSMMIPTGEREPADVAPGRLGSRTFDDAFTAPRDGAPLALSGGGRRIEVAFDRGYPYAQVYAPADDDVVALEPMTAPTNALVSGGPDLVLVAPGESYRATFSITVAEAPEEGQITRSTAIAPNSSAR